MEELIRTIPFADFKAFSDQTLLVYNLHQEGTPDSPFLEEITFLSGNCVDQTALRKDSARTVERLLHNMENGILHNPYSQEIHERDSIRNGDTEGLRLALNETFSGNYGTLSDNPLRQEIDMGIVTMTIATRAAIEGGLHYESIFSFCDLTIRQMEASSDPTTVRHIYRNAEYKLAEMVRDHKDKQKRKSEERKAERENHHVSRCKDYIFAHLHEKITVREIAESISLDPSYLSCLFSTCEHMTIKQYIMLEKINLAKNMLIYSSYTYIQIASYLGFCSQSHLGSEFKKATGMSLRQFRNAYLKKDFIDKDTAGQPAGRR